MKYRREIDGLRALAVVPVILFHAGFQTFSGGFVGVDVFFVISGYLITTIILAELEKGQFSIINFYERRARRILPALFFVMFVCLLFAWFWLLPNDMKDFSRSLVAVSAFTSNVLFWLTSGYFDTATQLKPLLHTWSLAVEEQYYVFFPVFLMLTWHLGMRWIIGLLSAFFLTSLALAHWGSVAEPIATFYLLPSRGWELLVGAFLAFYLAKGKEKVPAKQFSEVGGFVGITLILYSIFVFDKQTPFPSLYALVPTLGTGLIILCARHNTFIGRVLGNKVFVGIGLISYSAYLWHHPLFAFAKHRSLDEPSKLLLAVLAFTTVIFAYFSWKYVETPFRSKKRFSRKQVFLYGVSGSILFVAIGLAGHFTKGFPQRFDENLASIIKGFDDKNPRQSECFYSGSNYPHPKDSCVLGNERKIVGALLGDSHADAISYALEQQLTNSNIGFRSLTYIGCPPVIDIYRIDGWSNNRCYEYNQQSVEYVLQNRSIEHIVLVARWTMYLETVRFDNNEGGVENGGNVYIDAVENGSKVVSVDSKKRREIVKMRYRHTIEKYLDAGKKVILVYPIPEVGIHVPSSMAKKILYQGIESDFIFTTSFDAYKNRNQDAIDSLDVISNHINLIRIKPSDLLCDTLVKNRCATSIDGIPLYYDDDHLSSRGAKLVVNEILKHIGQ